MIKSIEFKHDGGKFHWRKNFEIFNQTIEFKPGLNVIIGPTGTGKSTLLDMVAHYMAAKQGGISTVTKHWLGEYFDMFASEIEDAKYEVIHDGKPIMYINPRDDTGTLHGQTDYDFPMLGFNNRLNTGSSGQKSMSRHERMLIAVDDAVSLKRKRKPVVEKGFGPKSEKDFERKGLFNLKSRPLPRELHTREAFPDEIDWRVEQNDINSVWLARYNCARKMFEPKIESGQRTIVMDEPDAGLSLPFQDGFWNSIIQKAVKADFQLIIASHSIFSLCLDNVHYIETEKGYLNQCTQIVRNFQKVF